MMLAGTASASTRWDATHPRRAEVNQRLANQNHRIHREVREGEMSYAEAAIEAYAKLWEQSATATRQETDVMERSEFLAATRQLAAAAEILAKAGPPNRRPEAFQMLAFFRRYDQAASGLNEVATSNDELFARTGHAAITMAGRNEFAASHALLEQARSLIPAA